MISQKLISTCPQLVVGDTIKRLQESYGKACIDRWADIQFDGTLEAIDQGIEAMVNFAKGAMDNQYRSIRENAMDDLEAAAYATTRELREALALNPTRVAALCFDPGHLLCAAVGQYLPYLPNDVQKTIVAGAELAEKCTLGILNADELSEIELHYREWVIPYLTRHMIYF